MTHSRRPLRTPLLTAFLALALALAGAGGVAAASAAAGAPAGYSGPATGEHLLKSVHSAGTPATVTDYTSHNWDGYFATDASHSTDFTAISASWTEPTATCNSKTSYAGFWIGFDGWWDQSVEQDGAAVECVRGTPTYNVWWEMYPYNSVQNGFSINPGDKIQASVTYSASTAEFTMVVKDATSGQTLTKSSKCHSDQDGCQRSSAEIISEDIGGGNDTDGLFYLPDYGTAAYANASVTDSSGHTGTLSDSAWQLGLVSEVSSTNITKQSTSSLNSTGTSFSTTWQHQ